VLPGSPDTLPVTYADGSGAVAAAPAQGALRGFAGEVGGARSLASVAVLSPGGSTLWLGTELLGGGELDDEVADGRFGAPVGWRFPSDAEQLVAAPDGGLELAICRSGTARDVASATGRARHPLPAGGGVSLCGCWRGDGGALGGAALAFYDSLDDDARPLETRDLLTGPSPAAETCFCRAAAPPRDARFAAVRLSHTPSASGNACVRFDRLRLIAWEPQSSLRVDLRVPNRVTHVLVTGVGSAAQAQLAWSVATLELP
jgi:hypothetical protein